MPKFETVRRVPYSALQMYEVVADVEQLSAVPAAVRGAGSRKPASTVRTASRRSSPRCMSATVRSKSGSARA